MLTLAERSHYDEHGYVVCRGVFARETCDALNLHLSSVIASVAAEYAAGTRRELGFWELMTRSRDRLEVFWDSSCGSPEEGLERKTMRIGHALHAVDPAFGAFCASPPLLERLQSLVGRDGRVVQSAIIYKQPRSEVVQFGMHQDASYLTTEPESLALAFVALDAMNAQNGCLEVIPGSHRSGLGVALRMGPRGFEPASGRRAPRPPSRERAVPLVIEQGDVVFLQGRAFHGSEANRSDTPRRALILHAMEASSRLAPTSWVVVDGKPPPLAPL